MMAEEGLRRILLAEDDPNDVQLTLAAFEEFHLANRVDVVRDGAEAWDYLNRRGAYINRRNGIPIVMLLDIKMPKIDGLELLRRVRTEPPLRTLPVVMLTSSRMETDLVRSYDLGANAFVVKPVQFQAFVEAVKRLGIFWALVNEPPPAHPE